MLWVRANNAQMPSPADYFAIIANFLYGRFNFHYNYILRKKTKNKEKTLIFQFYYFLKTAIIIIHHNTENYNLLMILPFPP